LATEAGRRRGRKLGPRPEVRDDEIGGAFRELEQGAAIELQGLDDAPLCVLDGIVDAVGRKVDEVRGEIGEKRLEL